MSNFSDLMGPSNEDVEAGMENDKPSKLKTWHFGAAAGGALFLGVVGAVVIHNRSNRVEEQNTKEANDKIKEDLINQMSPRN